MRTKNLTPFPLGARLTSTKPPQPELVLVVRGLFDLVPDGVVVKAAGAIDALAQGPLRAEAFEEDDEARVGEPAYPGDFADAKLAAEILVRGTCHPPTKHAVPESTATVALGTWSKTLRVFGPRVKGRAPEPFTSMRLRWAKALGGPWSAENPVGVGDDSSGLLPNVEYPDGRAQPAGFGPLNPAWPARAEKVGVKYGASYLPRAPYYAEDFDWSYFQAAPVDQRLARFPAGDEELVLTNLSATHSVLRTRLPGLRVRCFVNDVADAFREVRMLLDTIFVDADAGQVLLTWRGRTSVADAEFDDVKTVFVASEDLAAKPTPEADYRALVAAFEADPLDLDARLPKEEAAVMRAKTPEARADALAALLERERPGFAAEMAKGGAPLEDSLQVAAAANETEPPPPVAMPSDARVTLGIDAKELMRARELVAEHASGELDGFDQRLDALTALDPNFLSSRDFTGKDLTGIDLAGADLRGAIFERTNLRAAKLSGANLEGAMLFRADLTDADLRGAELVRVNGADAVLVGARLDGALLDRAFFVRCDAREARFDGARARHAMFHDAELSRAIFAGAKLDQCDFTSARIDAARFATANLARCKFLGATGPAIFDDADVDGAVFEAAKLRGASFQGARGTAVSFVQADLERADLRYASLVGCHFTRARLVRARLDAADLSDSTFFKADLEGASLVDAKLCGADLCKTTVTRAKFDRANLYDAKLLGAKGAFASFEGANLVRCVRPS